MGVWPAGWAELGCLAAVQYTKRWAFLLAGWWAGMASIGLAGRAKQQVIIFYDWKPGGVAFSRSFALALQKVCPGGAAQNQEFVSIC